MALGLGSSCEELVSWFWCWFSLLLLLLHGLCRNVDHDRAGDMCFMCFVFSLKQVAAD